MRVPIPLALALATPLVVLACGDAPTRAPDDPLPGVSAPEPGPPAQASAGHARNERFARRLASALRNAEVRAELAAVLAASPHPEGKVHFNWLVRAQGGRLARAMAQGAGESEAGILRDLDEAMSLEVYLPVPEHRARWTGGADLLVATAIADGESPIAFDLATGRRQVLDPVTPPETPVLVVVPSEHRYDGAHPSEQFHDPGSGSEGGGTTAGLYMTYASFTSTFESWFKGNPEFEVHVLGPSSPTSNAMTTLQCAGEHAGGPYAYDQNDKTWSGRVLLFSQAQLNAFKAQYPNEALRILVIEDDDTACVIKQDQNRLTNLMQATNSAYQTWTGGRDSTTSITKVYTKAKALYNVIAALASWINSNDEIVGTAIQDAVVGQTWPGANWIVKGENLITNGGIRLEMR